MKNARFLDTLRYRVAELSIGPSSLRNQGAPGVIAAARSYLKRLDLATMVLPEQLAFLSRLNEATGELQQTLPKKAQHFGTARKALNLFLRDALYCSDLASHFGLSKIRAWLELPLDSYVAKGLRNYVQLGSDLPKWTGSST